MINGNVRSTACNFLHFFIRFLFFIKRIKALEYLIQTDAADDIRQLPKKAMAKELKLIGDTVLTANKVKNFALLMFADKPNLFIPNAHVEIIMETKDGTSKMESKRFDGPIWIQARQVSRYFESEIMRSYTLRYDDRIEHDIIYNWPLITFEELSTNCILHKRYDNNQYIGIYVYRDKLEFINHNKPRPPLTIMDLNTRESFTNRKYINEEIKNMFFALDLIESYGSGIRRAKKALLDNKSPEMVFLPEHNEFDYTMVSVPVHVEFMKKENNSVDRNKSINNKILDLIQINPKITRKEITNTLGISDATIKRHINALKIKKIIRREGSNKTGKWIIENDEITNDPINDPISDPINDPINHIT